MASIQRKFLKIFANGADNTGVFGSCADGTKTYSSDPEVIQSKPAYNLGWLAATIGARKFPPAEELQALSFLATYHLAYLFEKGIPEYEGQTVYNQFSIVRQTGTYALYGSLTDNNTGNPLTDGDNWEFLQDLSQAAQQATDSVFGTVRLATEADIVAGSSSTDVATAGQLASHGFVTGDWKGTTLSSLQAGWCWGAGTIGNASSNATSRANADTFNLFKAYWEDAAYSYTGTTTPVGGAALQVYSSSGVAVAKGANALADWNANRQIAVVDFRDRVPAGRGNMVGSAGRLSGQDGGVNGNILGSSGGRENHTLTVAQLAKHQHKTALNVNFAGGGPSALENGSPVSNADFPSDFVGEDQPHNNVQPTMVCNIIIKL